MKTEKEHLNEFGDVDSGIEFPLDRSPLVPKQAILITPESLQAAGWKKMGNAWYGPANKKLTNFESEWQKWEEGKSRTVKYTFEI